MTPVLRGSLRDAGSQEGVAGVAHFPGTGSDCAVDAPTRSQQPWEEPTPAPGPPSR